MLKKWKLIILALAAIAVLAGMNYVGARTDGAHTHSASDGTNCCPGH